MNLLSVFYAINKTAISISTKAESIATDLDCVSLWIYFLSTLTIVYSLPRFALNLFLADVSVVARILNRIGLNQLVLFA